MHDGDTGPVDGPSPERRRPLTTWLACGIVTVAAVLLAVAIRERAATRAETARQASVQAATAALLPGTPAGAQGRTSLYPPDDPWRPYLADERTCPGGERTDLPVQQQSAVMICLIDWAREQVGLAPLPQAALLASTALQKANEILRCRNFAHAACSGDPAADVRAAGYRGTFGENLYIAGGRFGAPRVALDGWLNSPDHRENLFRAEWRIQGIALVKLPEFGQYRDMSLWVSHFGSE